MKLNGYCLRVESLTNKKTVSEVLQTPIFNSTVVSELIFFLFSDRIVYIFVVF